MDLVDVAILALRVALVVVLYVFLAFVVRGAVRALRPAPAAPAANPASVGREPETDAASGLRLLVLEAGGSDLQLGQVVVLDDGATLGRAGQSSLVLADPAVSAEHVRLQRLRQGWVVVDLGSTNGTLLNQTRIEGQAALNTGDVLAVGNVRLKVVGR